jgi:hypothetical protein
LIILLDIDGVMVPASGWKVPELLNDGFPGFSNKAVRSLNKILSTTNASILLTTSHKSKYSLEAWKKIFANRGIHAKISKLKKAKKSQTRKEEILHWLHAHPNVKNFVIIDDDKSLNDLPNNFKNKVILTSPLVGLDEMLADKAIETLQQSTVIQA